MIFTNLAYDKKAFDWKEIFLVNAAGQEDKTLAARYPTFSEWEKVMRESTKNEFADVNTNENTAKSLDKLAEIAETIYSKVKRTVKVYNAVPDFMTVMPGELGKTVEAHEIKGGKVYNRAYGGYMRISQLKQETYTITTKPAAVHFKVPVEQLKTGRITVADLVFAASQAILRYKVGLAFDTFVAAYGSGSGYATNCNSVAITSLVLNAAIDALAAQDVESINVIGRYSKLTPISDFTGFADVALEEIRQRGLIGRYRGADIQRVKYAADEVYGTVPFATSSIFLTSNEKSFARYVEVKEIERSTWIDLSDKTYHLTFDFEDGAAIWKLQYGHRIYNV